ncbi:hypothetical protein CY35_10G015500 [Sphagnum magellanicum]|nr:hypothetical protein CY35_10G015500 [Sphagnum magellanicum]KAH9549369.1 hypothetical protein CY35_10G015500 [Sphagnum magellanicum]
MMMMMSPQPHQEVRCQICLQHSSTSAFTPCNVLSPPTVVTNLAGASSGQETAGEGEEDHHHHRGGRSLVCSQHYHHHPYLDAQEAHASRRSFHEILMATAADTHYMSEEDYYGPAEDYQENRVLAENFNEDLGFGSEALQKEHHHQQQEEEDPEPEQSRKRGGGGRQGGGGGANKNKTHADFVKGRAQALQHLLELPLKTRQLFCVSEFYRHMALASPDSPCKVSEAYRQGGQSVGVSMRTARKWVEDWDTRGDGSFSDSQQGKHVKVEWLLQPDHLQRRARDWIEENCPKNGNLPGRESIVARFRDFCNSDLLRNVQPKPILDNGNGLQFGLHRKISMETARSWLHRLGFHNFKDYRGTAKKGKPNPPDALSTGKESIQERENGFKT